MSDNFKAVNKVIFKRNRIKTIELDIKMKQARIEYFMKIAIEEAKKALIADDVPIGAIVVKDDQIIAAAYNMREKNKSTTAHAELLAIEQACRKLKRWILDDCELYVTLEPCIMCFGAIIQARIPRVYFGAYDPKTGACGSLEELRNLKHTSVNHHSEFTGGILENECADLIRVFFKGKRLKKKADRALDKKTNE